MLAIEEKIQGIEKGVWLSQKSFYKTGGQAKYYLQVFDESQIRQAIMAAQEIGLPFFVIGKGSNILFSDQGFDGLIIEMAGSGIKELGDNSYQVWAGTKMSDLLKFSLENDLTGLEWVAGLPGTFGGAIFGNAGCYGGDMASNIEEVICLDKNDVTIRTLTCDECQFAYRQSYFQENKNLVIISGVIKLSPGQKEAIVQQVQKNVLDRNQKHQFDFPTAGCVFKNPKDFSAGALIDQCGLKGKIVGGARVSQTHANFIENFSQATSKDIFLLSEFIKSEVQKKFGIALEYENNFIGNF